MSYAKAKALAVILYFVAPICFAVEQVQLVGVFQNKAIITIDGTRYTLKIGETSPEGVKLISVGANNAMLMVNGERAVHHVGGFSTVTPQPSAAAANTDLLIQADARGMYFTAGAINGHAVKFLVDTGATVVAMNGSQARRLGIDFKKIGRPAQVATASGITMAYVVKLDRIKVGEIELFSIEGAVIDGSQPSEVLLGMSFLNRLDMTREGRVMHLKKR